MPPCKNYTLFPHLEIPVVREGSSMVQPQANNEESLRSRTPSLRSKTCVPASERSTPTISRASSSTTRTKRPQLAHTTSSPEIPRSPQRPKTSSRSNSSSPADRARSPGLYSEPSEYGGGGRSTPTLAPSSNVVSRATSTPTKESRRQRVDLHKELPPIRSIFPEYNPHLALRDQIYEPTRLITASVSDENINKSPDCSTTPVSNTPMSNTPMSKIPMSKTPKYSEGGIMEFVPASTTKNSTFEEFVTQSELCNLWDISTGKANAFSTGMRPFKLKMQQRKNLTTTSSKQGVGLWKRSAKPKLSEPLLAFCSTSSRPFYTVTTTDYDIFNQDQGQENHTNNVRVSRHNPSQLYANSSDPTAGCNRIADFTLSGKEVPDSANLTAALQPSLQAESSVQIGKIIPHQSILAALAQASKTQTASRIAVIDPHASSPAAQKLAQDAMQGAEREYSCKLTFNRGPGKKPLYVLSHPRIGEIHVEVEGNVQLEEESNTSRSFQNNPSAPPKGRIRLFLPGNNNNMVSPSMSSTSPSSDTSGFTDNTKQSPSFSTASTLVAKSSSTTRAGTTLLSLCLSDKSLTIHPPLFHLLSSDAYLVDTAITTLISVLLSETVNPRVSALMTFLPPPTRAISESSPPSKRSKLWRLPSSNNSTEAALKPKLKRSISDKAEQDLSVAIGAAVFILGAAVEGLSAVSEKAQVNMFAQGQGQGIGGMAFKKQLN